MRMSERTSAGTPTFILAHMPEGEWGLDDVGSRCISLYMCLHAYRHTRTERLCAGDARVSMDTTILISIRMSGNMPVLVRQHERART